MTNYFLKTFREKYEKSSGKRKKEFIIKKFVRKTKKDF